MKRVSKYIVLIGFLIVNSIFVLSKIFRNNLSDFALGFYEAALISCICGVAICICKHFTKNKKSIQD